jgi:hypothetical protein
MADFISSGVSWFIIILTLTALKSSKTEGDSVLADPGGAAFILNVVLLFARNASESYYIN